MRRLRSQVFDEQKRPTHLVSAINSVCQGGNKDATGKDCKTLSIDLDDEQIWLVAENSDRSFQSSGTYTSVQPIRLPAMKSDESDFNGARVSAPG